MTDLLLSKLNFSLPRPNPRSALLAAALVTMLCISACGISLDEEPRALVSPDEAPAVEPTNTDVGEAAAALFFSNTEELAPVISNLSNSGTETVLEALLRGVPAGAENRGFVTQVPSGTELLSSGVDGSEVTINLSEEFDNLTGAAKSEAVAQIVITVTNLAGIDSVSFQVSGNAQDVFSPLQGRDVSSVTACDFMDDLPNAEKARDLDLTGDELTALTLVRDKLNASCETS